jgi:hypothetical protein
MAGAMAIPLSEILSYCELLYIHDVDARERHIDWIQFIDNIYLQHMAEKREAEKPKK